MASRKWEDRWWSKRGQATKRRENEMKGENEVEICENGSGKKSALPEVEMGNFPTLLFSNYQRRLTTWNLAKFLSYSKLCTDVEV